MAVAIRNLIGVAIDLYYGFSIDPSYKTKDDNQYYTTGLKDALKRASKMFSSLDRQESLRASNIYKFVSLLAWERKYAIYLEPTESEKAIMLLALSLITHDPGEFAQFALVNTIKLRKPEVIRNGHIHPVSITGRRYTFEVSHKLRRELTYLLTNRCSDRALAASYILEKDLKKCGFTASNSRAIGKIISAAPSSSVLEAPFTLRCIWSLRKDSLFAKLPRDVAKIIIGHVKNNLQQSLITQIHQAARSQEESSLFVKLTQSAKRILRSNFPALSSITK